MSKKYLLAICDTEGKQNITPLKEVSFVFGGWVTYNKRLNEIENVNTFPLPSFMLIEAQKIKGAHIKKYVDDLVELTKCEGLIIASYGKNDYDICMPHLGHLECEWINLIPFARKVGSRLGITDFSIRSLLSRYRVCEKQTHHAYSDTIQMLQTLSALVIEAETEDAFIFTAKNELLDYSFHFENVFMHHDVCDGVIELTHEVKKEKKSPPLHVFDTFTVDKIKYRIRKGWRDTYEKDSANGIGLKKYNEKTKKWQYVKKDNKLEVLDKVYVSKE